MSILQGTDKSGVSGKERKILHLNDLDSENLEAPQSPVDHEKDAAVQEKFEGEIFYGSSRGIEKMTRSEAERRKFDAATKDQRANPEINHDRTPQDPAGVPDQKGDGHE